MIAFVLDTSALISLESIGILDTVMKNFEVITSPLVLAEINEFAIHEDLLGNVSKRILQKEINTIKPSIKDDIPFVSQTDNELVSLALAKNITLITDDVKLAKHSSNIIETEFSTYFLLVFVSSGLLTKQEALNKLESVRNIRNWQNNIIFITTKKEIENA